MAIAGGAVPCVLVRLVDGKLQVGGSQMVSKLIVHEMPSDAYAALRRNEPYVYLELKATNIDRLEKLVEENRDI